MSTTSVGNPESHSWEPWSDCLPGFFNQTNWIWRAFLLATRPKVKTACSQSEIASKEAATDWSYELASAVLTDVKINDGVANRI